MRPPVWEGMPLFLPPWAVACGCWSVTRWLPRCSTMAWRGYADAEIGPWLQERLRLIHASSLTALTDITPRPQVVYLDPMFPHKQKSALVKKEMRVFQSLVGPDLDADGLLAPARQLATKRVVVKRPDYAPPLADVATPNAVVTKGHRFDIYAGTAVEPQGKQPASGPFPGGGRVAPARATGSPPSAGLVARTDAQHRLREILPLCALLPGGAMRLARATGSPPSAGLVARTDAQHRLREILPLCALLRGGAMRLPGLRVLAIWGFCSPDKALAAIRETSSTAPFFTRFFVLIILFSHGTMIAMTTVTPRVTRPILLKTSV